MADNEPAAPLLDRTSRSLSPRHRSLSPVESSIPQSKDSRSFSLPSESTPLLIRQADDLPRYGEGIQTGFASRLSRDSSPSSHPNKTRYCRRWPTLVVIGLLCGLSVMILVLGFVAPSIVKEYAEEAAVLRPREFSINSITSAGVRARVKADFLLDSSRVKKGSVRDFGRFATWIAREVETGESEIRVYLPDYGNLLVGVAALPPLKLNIRDGQVNVADILADLQPGNVADLRRVANDWLGGRLEQLQVKGMATFTLQSGLLNLGSQAVSNIMSFGDHDLPELPTFNVTKLNVHEKESLGRRVMVADVSVTISNYYPLKLVVPPLGFSIFVPNCFPGDPPILVASATTDTLEVRPKEAVVVDGHGLIFSLPSELTATCPGRDSSPLDLLVANYIQGLETTVYVRGADAPSADTPAWIEDLMKSITVPVPVTGHDFGQLVRNFTMTGVHFYLPDALAEPGTPESQPTVSALVKVFVDLPKQMNFGVDIPRVRSYADVYYHGKRLGILSLRDWQAANATRIDGSSDQPFLLVQFDIRHAPLEITDADVFTDIVQTLIFKHEAVWLTVKAKVDGELKTALGQFVIRDIPAAGELKVKPPFDGSLSSLHPKIESVEISQTSQSSVQLLIIIDFTNPTEYSATIPLVDVLLLYNETAVAHLIAQDVVVIPGVNSGIRIQALWNPLGFGGEAGVAAGQRLMSQYMSGFNTTVAIRSHERTIPALPNLGRALSKIEIEAQIPTLALPGEDGGLDDDDKPHFIKDATLHIWSSTAVFTLLSPLPTTTLYITSLDATALYNHTEPVGTIDYRLPFAVPPGISKTPRLPVELNLGGVGYGALKKALGGTLRMDAKAKVGFRLGEYSTLICYQGQGIGAKVKI